MLAGKGSMPPSDMSVLSADEFHVATSRTLLSGTEVALAAVLVEVCLPDGMQLQPSVWALLLRGLGLFTVPICC